MKPDQVITLTATFEGHAHQTEDGIEYWLARDLQQLLGYTEWRNSSIIASKHQFKTSRLINDTRKIQ